MRSEDHFWQKILSRRMLLRALAEFSLLGVAGTALTGCGFSGKSSQINASGPGLGELARRRKRQFGVATQSGLLGDEDFAGALRRESGMLVPESELKWFVLRPSPDAFDFRGYRRLAAFARDNNMAMRGHVFVWHRANPGWLEGALTDSRAAEQILAAHISRVTQETAPMIRNWDVVNEAIHTESGREDGLREESIWLKALGPDYIPLAYRLAHAADPGLTLVYNDYGLEQGDAGNRRKRRCTLRLLEKCLHGGAPVHALGLQSHLQAHMPLAHNEFKSFLKDVRGLGLRIYITELDLDVSRLFGRMDDRVRLAQNYVRAYLNLVQEGGAIEMLLTWGLSDRYSWLRRDNPDLAGMLPLDDDLNRGPMWGTLKREWLKF